MSDTTPAITPEQPRVGRYRIERFLARGGMAEVFVGKAEGPGGFEKNVVIKRILPELVAEDRFVSMFLAEARLAAQLNHPNIVQVFDFGQQDGMYFLAMEYIQGESLRAILQAYENQGRLLPPAICAHVIAGVCEGLHYAHNLSDENGVSRNLVHRDVTPDNILISSSGVPKIVDFGIAKATSSSGQRTESGMLKGKYGYMSPEQIRGDGIDRRLDVYALGITLYEMLVGHRPYVAENELRLLKQIIQADAPRVEQLVPEIPDALGAAVAQAMSPDPNHRFRDARTLGNALQDFLASARERVAPFDVAEMVNGVTSYRRERRAEQGVPAAVSPPRGVPGLELEPVEIELTGMTKQPLRTNNPTVSVVVPPSEFEPWHVVIPKAIAAIAIAAVLILALTRLGRTPPPKLVTPTPVVSAVIVPPPPTPVIPARSPTSHVDEVAVPDPPTPAPTPAVAQPGFLTITAEPRCEILIDGLRLGFTPLRHQELASGAHWLMARNREQALERKMVVKIPAGGERFEKLVFGDGLLEVKVQPWANVFVDGRAYGQTPIQPLSLPEGTHVLKVENPDLQRSETRTVHVVTGGHDVVKIIW